jgi:uncharacterized membrane protein YbhN (UPF0104 family)
LNKLKKIIRLLITLACIAYLVKFFYSDRQSLKLVLKLDLASIACIVLLSVAYLLTYNFRFKIVFEKCSGQTLPFWPVFKILMVANFLNMVLSQVGNIYRGVRLKKEFSVSYTRYISSLTSVYWIDTCLNFIIAVIVILFVKSDFQIGPFTAWKLFALMGLVTLAVPVAADMLLSLIKIKNHSLAWIHSKLTEVLSVTINNLKDIRYILKIISLGTLVLLVTAVGNYIIFRGFGIILTTPALLVLVVLLRLSTFITITPGNIGVQEIAYGFISQQMGIGMAEGILASVVTRVFSSIIIIALGLLFGGIDTIKVRKKYSGLES